MHVNSPLAYRKRDYVSLSLALRGRHQRNNAATALAALELGSDPFPVNEEAVREGLRTVVWPGRFEVVREKPTVILDGAHNREGASALAEGIEEYRQGRKIKLLFASMEDKDWQYMLATLSRFADEVVLTRVAMERSADPRLLAAQLSDQTAHRVIEGARQGLNYLLGNARAEDIVLVTGSLYLLGEVRPALLAALRVEYPDGFGLARASNTTPVIVLRFEADNSAALERIMAEFRRVLSTAKPGIALPF